MGAMGFRENLKAELLYQNIRVKELAARTGISKHTLDNYLNVRGYMPSADVAVKIAGVLGVSVEYLVTGADARAPKTAEDAEIGALIRDITLLDEEARLIIGGIVRLYKNRRQTRNAASTGHPA